MIKEIAEKIKQYCPSAIVLIISNPADVLTYFFKKNLVFLRFKVIGIASSLDSSRFRYFVSEKLSVPQSSILMHWFLVSMEILWFQFFLM